MVRAVLDTNVWISGIFFSRGAPAQLLAAWRDEQYEVIHTATTLEELSRTLRRKAAQFGAPSELPSRWLEFIQTYAVIATVETPVSGVSRDPDDDAILEAAVAGGVDYLVTGDQDLLVLQAIGAARIVTPREFLNTLSQV